MKTLILILVLCTVTGCLDNAPETSVTSQDVTNTALAQAATRAVAAPAQSQKMSDAEYASLISAYPVFEPGGAQADVGCSNSPDNGTFCCARDGGTVCCCYAWGNCVCHGTGNPRSPQ